MNNEIHREMIGDSFVMYQLRRDARLAAASGADILIEAESGAGKEVLARYVHQVSARAGRPFVAVNCAALGEAQLGGKFSLANGGTLFLDEIGEMPVTLQPKLLRVLQEREVDPAAPGASAETGESQPAPVDVRVIATTNRPLAELVEDGEFRADLYYRLNVIPLKIPALRERREDIPALVEYFQHRYAKSESPLPPGFLTPLAHHSWPGNVRELENLVRRVLALGPQPVECVTRVNKVAASLGPGNSMRDMEKQMLQVTLEATGGNRTHAAQMLGVSLRTIRNKIREFGLPARARMGGMA